MTRVVSRREALALSTWAVIVAAVATVVTGSLARHARSSESYELARTASLAVLVVAAGYFASAVVLEIAAPTALAQRWVRLGRWCVACMRRHPSLRVRLLAHVALLDCAWTLGDFYDPRALEADLRDARKVASCPWSAVNLVIDRLVTAGRYREALNVVDAWPSRAARIGHAMDPVAALLARINRAEALHNLGRDDEALAALDEVLPRTRDGGFVESGALTLEAWIRAARGDPESLSLIDAVPCDAMGKLYVAEHHFTRALALCAMRELDAASREARNGLKEARRPSSERNGWFLLGIIAFRSGDIESALKHFDRGLGAPYRGQGGWALLQRARALRGLGRSEARAGLELVVARDPESVFASEARRELERME